MLSNIYLKSMSGAKYYGIHLQHQAEVGRSQVLGRPGLHSKTRERETEMETHRDRGEREKGERKKRKRRKEIGKRKEGRERGEKGEIECGRGYANLQ